MNEYGIRIRDVMLLAFISQQDTLTVGQISEQMGLARRAVVESACRLIRAGLADAQLPVDPNSLANRILPSKMGRSLARRIHGS